MDTEEIKKSYPLIHEAVVREGSRYWINTRTEVIDGVLLSVDGLNPSSKSLIDAFDWSKTEQGDDFWRYLHKGQMNMARTEFPSLFKCKK